ncbi:hypothetical protein J6N69_06625 [bacterium]|nr:hypothetical protein [bacterium]
MSKVDNIHFTGFRNPHYYGKQGQKFLYAELTGQDLHKFRRAVRRAAFDKGTYDNKSINNACVLNSHDGVLYINNIPVEEIDESIPLFEFAAKLTRRLAKRFDENIQQGAKDINRRISDIMMNYFEV